MIGRKPIPVKILTLWAVIICAGLLTSYVVFLGLISIWVGLSHLQEDSFWMPILTGAIALVVVLLLFFRFVKFLLSRMKEKEYFRI